MDYNIHIRENQLQNFQQFIDSAKTNLTHILDVLGWSEELVKEKDQLVTCSYDKSHRVSLKNLEEHHKNCSIRQLGYNIDDILLSEPVQSTKSSIIIDRDTKQNIFKREILKRGDFKTGWNGDDPDPKTSERLMSTFSADERLTMYEFVISATEGPKIPPEFSLTQPIEDERELSYEERLELERNAKRRRIKYKSVHTNRKNHTEVMREVIANQMEQYQDCLGKRSRFSVKQRSRSKSHERGHDTAQENEDTVNASYDDTRSVASKHSTHSGTSSHHRPQHHSRGSSYDYDDRDKYRRRRDDSRNRHHYKDKDSERRDYKYSNSNRSKRESKEGNDRDKSSENRSSRSRDYDKRRSNGNHRDNRDSRDRSRGRYDRKDGNHDRRHGKQLSEHHTSSIDNKKRKLSHESARKTNIKTE